MVNEGVARAYQSVLSICIFIPSRSGACVTSPLTRRAWRFWRRLFVPNEKEASVENHIVPQRIQLPRSRRSYRLDVLLFVMLMLLLLVFLGVSAGAK